MSDDNGVFRPKSRTEQVLEAKHGLPIDVLLRRLYVTEGLSQEQISDVLGIARPTVSIYMARYRIPTRDRRAVAA